MSFWKTLVLIHFCMFLLIPDRFCRANGSIEIWSVNDNWYQEKVWLITFHFETIYT